MTDFDKTIAFLDGFGIEYEINDKVETEWVGPEKVETINIRLYEGCKKVGGYGGFFTEFTFNPKGEFVEVGAWE